jgi:uncharacterized membrane-anchored protein
MNPFDRNESFWRSHPAVTLAVLALLALLAVIVSEFGSRASAVVYQNF